MTIAAGFKCSDGILVASDTLYSGAVQQTYGSKLWLLHEDNPVVVFGGAARSIAALTRARDEIRRKLKPAMSIIAVVDRIDECLLKVNTKFGQADWPDVQALVGIRAEQQTVLYQNVATKVALSPVDLPTVCVGTDSLGDYFAHSLFRADMPIRWAKVVAAHLVWNCKKYASGYCGGDTHLVEIPQEGPAVVTTNQQSIAALEAHLAGLDEAMRIVLPDGRANEDTLVQRLVIIKKAIDDLGHQFFVSARGDIRIGATMNAHVEVVPDSGNNT